MERTSGSVTHLEDMTWFDAIPGERLAILVRADETGGRCSVMRSVAQPGAAAPLHRHREDEIFFVLRGAVTYEVAGEVFKATGGATIVIPAGTEHRWKNRGDEPIEFLATFSSGGAEALFPQVAGKSPDEVARIAVGYGTIVTGPPMGVTREPRCPTCRRHPSRPMRKSTPTGSCGRTSPACSTSATPNDAWTRSPNSGRRTASWSSRTAS